MAATPVPEPGGANAAGAAAAGEPRGRCPLLMLPAELLVAACARFADTAQPVGRLACVARWARSGLTDAGGRLRVGSVVTCRLRSVVEGLPRVSLQELENLRVDLSLECRECLCPGEVEEAIQALGRCIAGATALRTLALRLASFDVSMVRLRLSGASWEALVLGLEALARYQRLRSLELSSIAIKASQLTKAVGGGAKAAPEECPAPQAEGSPARVLRRAASSPTRGAGAAAAAAAKGAATHGQVTLLGALGRLSSLEELVLAYDEIFGTTAVLLPPALSGLAQLKKLDLTRNHIPKQVMHALREEMPARVEQEGLGATPAPSAAQLP